jgi:hypothetical protein
MVVGLKQDTVLQIDPPLLHLNMLRNNNSNNSNILRPLEVDLADTTPLRR